MEETNGNFAQWVVLELMGHRRLAGFLTEQQIGGASFLRIDVPGPSTPEDRALHGENWVASQLYAPSAVYCITPIGENLARSIAQDFRAYRKRGPGQPGRHGVALMGDQSAIEWTDATWNPVVGCDRISPGCANCYAKAIHDRRHKSYLAGGNVLVPQYAKPFEVVVPREDRLDIPLHWRRPRRVFVNSMSDLFHEDVPDDFIFRVFDVMNDATHHTFQVLTKRPARMLEAVNRWHDESGEGTPDNVWLGVSVENQHFADERIPILLQTPAAIHFISAEPLLGPLELAWEGYGPYEYGYLREGIEWCIVGGESGAGARPMDLAWVRSILAQCRAVGVPCFIKQLGARPVTDGDATHPGPLRLDQADRKGGDISEWPGDLRVREYPSVVIGAQH